MNHNTRWTSQKIAQRLQLIEPLVYRRREVLPAFRYLALASSEEAAPVESGIDDASWETIEPNSYWGTWMTNFVLRSSFQVPTDWPEDVQLALFLPLGEAGDFSHPEALAYLDGEAYAACDRHHQEIILPERYHDGQRHQLALHGWTGLGGLAESNPFSKLFMKPCELVLIDQPSRDFIATARTALGIADHLEANEPAKGQLYNALDAAFRVLDSSEPLGEAFYASVAEAHAVLRAGIDQAGPSRDLSIMASGHAHIDVAWLWTLGQTRRKAGRTFHTVLRLMEAFPDFHFTQSQPQLYDYVQQDYPELFEAIKARVAEGRWEPTGGMWVEADCNLSGGESLARQFLLGRRYFESHFGAEAESRVLWLPDVFGYAWNLPQLIKEAGLEYFFTIKISWNQYNRLPYDSFWWQGLDGTKVLTHFSTTPGNFELPGTGTRPSNYNATATPEEALETWTNLQQKDQQQTMLMAVGYGDGGGGPTREMLENIREMHDFPATPQMRYSRAGDFFTRLEEESGEQLPTWNGELYLEYHRGTYTSQSRNKRANRKSEFLLHDAEFLASQASVLDTSYAYPGETLRKAWELVCLNQFHDIIPGSSIGPVYQESLEQYEAVASMTREVREAALAVIGQHLGGDLLLVNPSSFERSDLAFWTGQLETGQALTTSDGTMLPTQSSDAGTWLAVDALAPHSVNSLQLVTTEESSTASTGLSITERTLENSYVRLELNDAGDITRIYDKQQQREVLPAGGIANQLQAFEDRPMFWDAWDVDIFFEDRMWLAEPASSISVLEAGPLRATLEVKRRICHSDLVQRISLRFNSAQIDFDTSIDWQERHVLLKAAFPVAVLSPVATYEIQWGNVERPTHRNTSWDWARFETCAQKWVDLSEGDYGVSLLNDCKYGHDIRDNVMRLSLLRSPTMPDPDADRGEQHFSYSLLPHQGSWGTDTIGAAYALNDPLLVSASSQQAATQVKPAFIRTDHTNIVIETIKRAEDGEGIVVRLYESQRRRGKLTLSTNFEIREAWQTNILEQNQAALEPRGNHVTVAFRPYQIITLRFVPN